MNNFSYLFKNMWRKVLIVKIDKSGIFISEKFSGARLQSSWLYGQHSAQYSQALHGNS